MATFNIFVKKIKETVFIPLVQQFATDNGCQTLFEFLVWAPAGATLNLTFVGPINDSVFVTLEPTGSGFISLGSSYSFIPNAVFRPLRVMINNTNIVETINVEITAQYGGVTEVINISRDSTGESCY